MKKAIIYTAFVLASCSSASKKDFSTVKEGMDTVQVAQQVGTPTQKIFTSLFGKTIGLWAYKSDTALITFNDGKVSRVLHGNDLKQAIDGMPSFSMPKIDTSGWDSVQHAVTGYADTINQLIK